MPEYKFSAMLKDGNKIRGKTVATNKSKVVSKLRQSNMQPIRVVKLKNNQKENVDKNRKLLHQRASFDNLNVNKNNKKFKFSLESFSKVKTKDIISFSNNLYILKKASFNNIKALETLYNGTTNLKLKDTIEDLLIGVEEGEKLSTLMGNYPNIFDSMYVGFIKLGEKSGSLESALYNAREYLESSTALKKNIRKVLIPRLAQFIFLWIMIIGGVILGVPMMQGVYDMFDSSATIPPATQIAFDASQWLMSYWYIILAVITGAVLGFIYYINTLRGRYNFDKYVFHMPVIGNLVRNIIISRFFSAMLMNIRNGMRLQESLESSKNVSNNYYFLSIIEIAKSNVLAGKSWLEPFEYNNIFQPMTLQMVSVGMKTDLSEMMEKVTEYLNMEIDESLERFTKWLPEITYIFIGILLIIFMFVIMVPIINIYMGGFLM